VSRYLKFIAQVFATGVAAIVAASADNRVDAAEWINVLILTLGAVSVLGAGELPAGVWAHTKTIVAGVTAGAVLAVSYVSDGWYITTTEWLQIGLAVLAAIGIAVVPGPKVQALRGAGLQQPGVADHAA
jgi:hypothetical protein